MADRKNYFVTLDTEDIREVSIPGNEIEYEIIATHDEVEEIEEIFMKKNKEAENATKYIGKPFDEWGADDEREIYDAHLMKIYQRLYDLGTDETKSKIKELGIIN
ncbi:hypothetical protein KFZ58_08785 [Virgibacillus sp. NKC19-16]|uniref:hypothetical protein n=1 Tax=Virgibacillus salidurans TaxID=2831673 RepID=UPI001F40010E|nr:hypothetical protein [Virgibacillus sp. NKC19-16]UJL47927.1 hypothetical protein KFZ58_08785 [Virgibacillus sp. NKC19-16]